jgi:hypothetical protein
VSPYRRPARPRQICGSCGQPLPEKKAEATSTATPGDAAAVARVRAEIEASKERGETDQEFQLRRGR